MFWRKDAVVIWFVLEAEIRERKFVFSSVLSVHAELVTAFFRLRSTSVKEDFLISPSSVRLRAFFWVKYFYLVVACKKFIWGPARVNSDKRHGPKSSDRA